MGSGSSLPVGPEVGKVESNPRSPSLSEVDVVLKPNVNPPLRPMEYLLAEISDTRLGVLRVLDMVEENPHATAESIALEYRGVPSVMTRVPREQLVGVVVRAITEYLDEIEIRSGHAVSIGKQDLIRAGARVFRPSSQLPYPFINPPKHPLEIGHVIGPGVPAVIETDHFTRHVLIIGGTGCGKSWLRGLLMELLYDLGVAQVIFDIHGEYVEAARVLGGRVLRAGRDFRVRLDLFSEGEFADIISFYLPTEFQRSIAMRAFAKFRAACRSALAPLPPNRLLDFVYEAGRELNAGRDTMTNTVQRMTAFLDDFTILGEGVNWPQLVPRDKERRRVVIDIDCRGLSDLELQVLVAGALRELEYYRRRGEIPPLIVSFDEAHVFIPRTRGRSISGTVIKKLLRWGRHYGIGIIMITQFPDSVEEEAVRLPATRFIFAIDPPQLKGIRTIIGDLPEAVVRQLPRLETGVCVLTGTRDVLPHSVMVKVSSRRRTPHGGRTPSFFEE